MNALEVVLLVAGIICIIISFFIDPEKSEQKEAEIDIALDESKKQHIRDEVDKLIEEQLEAISDQTEGALEKLSNTKIMEVGEYADTVYAEINRRHNEVMFLYDMLNEKSKDVKTTVKSINETKKQVERLSQEQEQTEAINASNEQEDKIKKTSTRGRSKAKKETNQTIQSADTNATDEKNSLDVKETAKDNANEEAKESAKDSIKEEKAKKPRTTRTTRKKTEKSRNELIVEMHEKGIDDKTIARELGIGIGEVSLILGLKKL